jgi:cobalt-zinc-cadmium efflux system protein
MSHHAEAQLGTGDADKSRRLVFATAVTVGILVAEVVGSWLSGSLALLSDAAHVFADVLALLLSLLALRLACRLPTATRTYGLHRAEIFAALLNGITLLVIAGLIGYEAWRRCLSPPEIKTVQMLIVAVVGLAANALVLTRLSGHHHDLNMRGAYLHVLGDMLASVGVVVGALVMQFTGWYLADPIISALIGLLILGGAWRLLSESVHILLLGVPRHLNVSTITAAMRQVADVVDIHNVRLWAPCSNVAIFSAHVVTCATDETQRVRVRDELRRLLAHDFGVTEVTLELEEQACPANGLIEPVAHPEPHEHGHDH